MHQKINRFSLFLIFITGGTLLSASPGDTMYVKPFSTVSFNHYGNFDKWGVFPTSSSKFQRIMMKYTVSCESGGQCEWDYTNTIYVRKNTGTKDSLLSKATSFTVNGQVKDSFNYSTDTTWKMSYNSTKKSTDSVPSTQATVIRYTFVSAQQPQVPMDTLKVWPVQYYQYHYDSLGKKKDSVYVEVQQTIKAVYTNYYKVFDKIIDYEMGRMITPYAKSGTLPRPFAYEYLYDVTDYAGLLHDSVEIRLNYSGYSWGFTGTIEFFMIEGVPDREAIKVENVYDGYFPYGNASNSIENYIPSKSFIVPVDVSSVKLALTITGHGAENNEGCSEFCDKRFYLKLNNQEIAERHIWKDDCGSNPIINQGGTWIYNRANWCPGEIVERFEYPLNVVAGSSNSIDLDMEEFISNGSAGYAISTQLIYYKANSRLIDAGIELILAPSKNFIYNRTNPICDNAAVILKNMGTQTLTQVEFKYQIGNSFAQTSSWTGSLSFNNQTTVELPSISWPEVITDTVFRVWINKVNGQGITADENTFNNSLTSKFDLPKVVPNRFVIETRTNNNPSENSYTIKGPDGKIVFSKNFTQPGTLVRDTFNFAFGCYSFDFIDNQGDGLSFWANTSQGSGYVRFVSLPPQTVLKTFNADFGNFLNFNFRVQSQVGVEEKGLSSSDIAIYPNPASDYLHIESLKIISSAILFNIQGEMLHQYSTDEISQNELSLSTVEPGIYLIRLQDDQNHSAFKKFALLR